MHGHIAVIGILAGFSGEVSAPAIFVAQARINGVNVGSRTMQEEMIAAINVNGIKPVIDSTHSLDDIGAAFAHFEARAHFGKVCLTY